MEPKKIRLVLVLCVILLVVVSLISMLTQIKPAGRVGEEQVQCVSAVCVIDAEGTDRCFEFKSRVAHTYTVPDVDARGAVRLMVVLNNNSCRG